MPLCVRELVGAGLNIPVLIGGAAINRQFGWRSRLLEEPASRYEAGVFYCRDAFEGLDTMTNLQVPEERVKLHEKLKREAHLHRNMIAAGAERASTQQLVAVTDVAPRSVAEPPKVSPPFWGTRVVPSEDLALRDIFDHLDLVELYRLQWGVKPKSREQYQQMIAGEFTLRRHELQEECIANGWLRPQVIYGYFPCSSSGNDLKVFVPEDAGKPLPDRRLLWKFNFPRKIETPRKCLADFFGDDDVVAFQTVTVGDKATQLCAEWEAAGEFSRAYYLHGLSVETAEALAEYWHRRVRAEMGLPPEQGKRYSAGYPAWPDLADQAGVWAILHPEQIGVTLTEAHQMVPEQSTSAIIVWHPEAFLLRRPRRRLYALVKIDFGIMQWTPLRTSTTWLTRQSAAIDASA